MHPRHAICTGANRVISSLSVPPLSGSEVRSTCESMRLPQELVDAIVAHVERGIDLINLLCASRTVFFSQVFRSLRHVVVHLSTDDAYRLLIGLLEDHPAALSQIRLLEISLESYTQNIPKWHGLPALLDACTGIRVLCICVGHYRVLTQLTCGSLTRS